MGTEELDKILQSEINKADQANLKKKNSLSDFEENIDLVNQEIQNQPEDILETNMHLVFDDKDASS